MPKLTPRSGHAQHPALELEHFGQVVSKGGHVRPQVVQPGLSALRVASLRNCFEAGIRLYLA
jgi:hypothetical protein